MSYTGESFVDLRARWAWILTGCPLPSLIRKPLSGALRLLTKDFDVLSLAHLVQIPRCQQYNVLL